MRLFPLPNVVLFPRAVLPLHIFEERYKEMTADALAGDHRIAMALLLPGWEKDYHGRAAIEPVVCVGRVVAHERLADGKYNLLLEGESRARVVGEKESGRPYRVAEAEPVSEPLISEAALAGDRGRLRRVFDHGPVAGTGMGRKFAELFAGDVPTAAIADLIAFNFIDDVKLKQFLLSEADVARRVGYVARAMEGLAAALGATPANRFKNPGMN